MEKKHYLDLLLFLIEIKAKNGINKEFEWELNRNIAFLKTIIEADDQEIQKLKKSGKAYTILSQIIGGFTKYFLSP